MTLRLTLFGNIEPSPRKTWLVKGLIGDGELACMFGAPGSGKSVLAGDMAAHIAAGKAWLGRDVTQGGVLYVAAERASLVKRRYAAWAKHFGIADIPLGIVDGAIDLRSSLATAREIIGRANELADTFRTPLRLVVVDTVSRALAGGDENSPKDMGALVSNASLIQSETKAAVCLLHHIPADGTQRLRGHGALLGAVDVSISVEKHAAGRTATLDKANDGEEGERVTFDLEGIKIADDGTTAPVVIPAGDIRTDSKRQRKLPDRIKNSLDVLADQCLDGKPLQANGHDLPQTIRAIPVDTWREELYRRGVLDKDHPSPRQDFYRVKDKLLSRGLAAERDGQIWAV